MTTTPDTSEETMTPMEASKRIGVRYETLLKWINTGWMDAIRLPNGWYRVRVATVEEILRPKKLNK